MSEGRGPFGVGTPNISNPVSVAECNFRLREMEAELRTLRTQNAELKDKVRDLEALLHGTPEERQAWYDARRELASALGMPGKEKERP